MRTATIGPDPELYSHYVRRWAPNHPAGIGFGAERAADAALAAALAAAVAESPDAADCVGPCGGWTVGEGPRNPRRERWMLACDTATGRVQFGPGWPSDPALTRAMAAL